MPVSTPCGLPPCLPLARFATTPKPAWTFVSNACNSACVPKDSVGFGLAARLARSWATAAFHGLGSGANIAGLGINSYAARQPTHWGASRNTVAAFRAFNFLVRQDSGLLGQLGRHSAGVRPRCCPPDLAMTRITIRRQSEHLQPKLAYLTHKKATDHPAFRLDAIELQLLQQLQWRCEKQSRTGKPLFPPGEASDAAMPRGKCHRD